MQAKRDTNGQSWRLIKRYDVKLGVRLRDYSFHSFRRQMVGIGRSRNICIRSQSHDSHPLLSLLVAGFVRFLRVVLRYLHRLVLCYFFLGSSASSSYGPLLFLHLVRCFIFFWSFDFSSSGSLLFLLLVFTISSSGSLLFLQLVLCYFFFWFSIISSSGPLLFLLVLCYFIIDILVPVPFLVSTGSLRYFPMDQGSVFYFQWFSPLYSAVFTAFSSASSARPIY